LAAGHTDIVQRHVTLKKIELVESAINEIHVKKDGADEMEIYVILMACRPNASYELLHLPYGKRRDTATHHATETGITVRLRPERR